MDSMNTEPKPGTPELKHGEEPKPHVCGKCGGMNSVPWSRVNAMTIERNDEMAEFKRIRGIYVEELTSLSARLEGVEEERDGLREVLDQTAQRILNVVKGIEGKALLAGTPCEILRNVSADARAALNERSKS